MWRVPHACLLVSVFESPAQSSFAAWQTFFADSFVQEHVRLDAVVCLCDSPRLLRTLVGLSPTQSAMGLSSQTAPDTDEPKADERRDSAIGDGEEGEGDIEAMTGKLEESRKEISDPASALVLSQLALSDRVLLNKADLVTPEEVWCKGP